jgi:hypothetical protein
MVSKMDIKVSLVVDAHFLVTHYIKSRKDLLSHRLRTTPKEIQRDSQQIDFL